MLSRSSLEIDYKDYKTVRPRRLCRPIAKYTLIIKIYFRILLHKIHVYDLPTFRKVKESGPFRVSMLELKSLYAELIHTAYYGRFFRPLEVAPSQGCRQLNLIERLNQSEIIEIRYSFDIWSHNRLKCTFNI